MFEDISKITRMEMMSVSEHELANQSKPTLTQYISDVYPYLAL